MLDNRNISGEKLITLHKINKKYYDYKSFLRKYIPYVIRWDINNNYYIVNRDYQYIGLKVNLLNTRKEEKHICLMTEINHGIIKKIILDFVMSIKK